MPEAETLPQAAQDETLILARLSPEILLKSPQVRRRFQEILRRNLRHLFEREGVTHSLEQSRGRLLVRVPKALESRALSLLGKVFGIASFSVVQIREAVTLDSLVADGTALFADEIRGKRFAVRCKRMGEKVVSTRDVEIQLGAALAPLGTVDLTKPEVTARVDLANDLAYFYTDKSAAAGGLPIGTQGKVVALISGGFDSVVAAWQMMKRGAEVEFVLCNLAGTAAERMVLQVVKVLCHLWGSGMRPTFHVVDFQGALEDIRATVRPSYWQITLKRLMYKAAEGVAREVGAEAIVTGEALGQVSSQTLSNLATIDAATTMPVLRPLVGFDKKEITALAYHIGTARLSEHVPEHCSITPKKPATQSTLSKVEDSEAGLDPETIPRAVAGRRQIAVNKVTATDLRVPYLWKDAVPEGATLIDCQPPEYRRLWSAPGALPYPLEDLERAFKELPKDRVYVLYCPRGVISSVMAEHLQQRGYEAYAYRGGLTALRKELGLEEEPLF